MKKLHGGSMKIDSERIKKVMKDTCERNIKLECYNIMTKILDFIITHENMNPEDLQNNIKYIIDQEDN